MRIRSTPTSCYKTEHILVSGHEDMKLRKDSINRHQMPQNQVSSLPPPAILHPSTLMDSRYYQESSYPDYSDPGFPGHYVSHHPFFQRSNSPTYWVTPFDPTIVPPTQYVAVRGVGDGLGQTPAISPMIPSANPTLSRGSEGDCSFMLNGKFDSRTCHIIRLPLIVGR